MGREEKLKDGPVSPESRPQAPAPAPATDARGELKELRSPNLNENSKSDRKQQV
jgi:hypothetical protein